MKRLVLVTATLTLAACDIDVPVGDRDSGSQLVGDGGSTMQADAGQVECVDRFDCSPRPYEDAVCALNHCIYSLKDGGGPVTPTDAGQVECVDRFDCKPRPYEDAVCSVNQCIYSLKDAGSNPPGGDGGGSSMPDAGGKVDAGVTPVSDAGFGPLFDGGLRLFITRSTFTGNLGGLSGADSQCQLAAQAAELGGTWVAFVSDGTTEAPARMTAPGPWFQLGTKIFNNLANLRTNPLERISIDETGASWGQGSGSGYPIWTGTVAGGAPATNTCLGFTSASSGSSGMQGATWQTTSPWVADGDQLCYREAHVLCFEQSHAPAPVKQPDTHRRLFITRSTFTGALGGLAGADAKCQLAAEAANITGTWKAFLSDGTVSAPSRMAVDGPWFQLGTKIFNNLANLRTNPLERISIDETGASWGQGSGSGYPIWTGTVAGGAPATNTCLGFTSASSGSSGMQGATWQTTSPWVADGDQLCYREAHLLCLEQ